MITTKIQDLVDDRRCYEQVRELRWAEGVKCPYCGSLSYRRQGHHASCEYRHCYQCKACKRPYDDLTNTAYHENSQPLKIWVLCLKLLKWGFSTAQIAEELNLSENECLNMIRRLREESCEDKFQRQKTYSAN